LDGVERTACSNGIAALDGVVNYVIEHARENAVVAIDAPLVITNETGQRPCGTLTRSGGMDGMDRMDAGRMG